MSTDLTADQVAESILIAHQRRDVSSCLCGWSELGRSHAGHQVAMLRENNLTNLVGGRVPTDDDDERPTTLYAAAVAEQIQLWGDLEQAMEYAIAGCWSIRCENVAYRIQSLALLAGPTRWEEVSVVLLREGVYARVLTEVGLPVPEPDWDQVARCEERIFGQSRGRRGTSRSS